MAATVAFSGRTCGIVCLLLLLLLHLLLPLGANAGLGFILLVRLALDGFPTLKRRIQRHDVLLREHAIIWDLEHMVFCQFHEVPITRIQLAVQR